MSATPDKDHEDPQQRKAINANATNAINGSPRSFHWPPTSEELESIEVVAMSDLARERSMQLVPRRQQQVQQKPSAAWRRRFEGPVVAQAGLAAASLAAIGIAVTSALAPTPPAKAARGGAAVAPSAFTATATPTSTPAPAITFSPSPRTPSVPPANASEAASQATPIAAATARSRTATLVDSTRTARTDTRPIIIWSGKASAHGGAPTPRRVLGGTRPAGSDPVSRLAARTGTGVWKVMRAVGRSFKREDVTTRSANARRTAAGANLATDNALSDQ
jgi:hypothetical protein